MTFGHAQKYPNSVNRKPIGTNACTPGVSPQVDWACIAAKAGGCLATCGPDIPCLIGCAGLGIIGCL